ncbi:g11521 [Coccomyxa viridis]|uniref:G11521 protein n=1 Tax=Coccomyxa viridis TaxID=1274662 RepID=A0ABP1G838_9CHLO
MTYPVRLDMDKGAAWTLRRVQAAPWLSIHASHMWIHSLPESCARFADSLQEHVKAFVAATKELRHLKMLDMDVRLDVAYAPERSHRSA